RHGPRRARRHDDGRLGAASGVLAGPARAGVTAGRGGSVSGALRRRASVVVAIVAVLAVTAVGPGRVYASARALLTGPAPTGGMSFLPISTPMSVTADSLVASSLALVDQPTITLADGSTRKVNHYRFQKL